MKNLINTLVVFVGFFAIISCKAAGVDTVDADTTGTGTTMHTVTIVLNDGTGVSDQPQKVEDGKTFTIGKPSKAGFVFKGWSTNNTLSNLDFTSGHTEVKGDITIYAMFNKLYTVTIDPSGGTVKTPSYPVEDGSSLTLTDLPQKTLYTFGGYKNGTTTYTLNTPFVVNGDMTLTAQWSVDLYAVRDMLTGANTSGTRWSDPANNGALNDYIDFKLISNNQVNLEVGYNWHFFNTDSVANSTTVITASDNAAYLAKIDPPLSTPYNVKKIVYIVSLSNNSFTYHTDSGDERTYIK